MLKNFVEQQLSLPNIPNPVRHRPRTWWCLRNPHSSLPGEALHNLHRPPCPLEFGVRHRLGQVQIRVPSYSHGKVLSLSGLWKQCVPGSQKGLCGWKAGSHGRACYRTHPLAPGVRQLGIESLQRTQNLNFSCHFPLFPWYQNF